MKYKHYKDFLPSLRKLYQEGGPNQRAAETAQMILGRIGIEENPFQGVPTTNHGESRIVRCTKYDLNGFCRLITIQENDFCVLCFIGNHDDCEKWLNRNRGFRLTVDCNSELVSVYASRDIQKEELRIAGDTDLSNGKLFTKISERYYDRIAQNVPRSLLRKFEDLETVSTEEEILELSCRLEDNDLRDVFFDVFTLLRKGDTVGAKNRIDLFTNESRLVEVISQGEIEEIVQNDSFVDFEQFEPELIKHFIETASFQQWMLFMHPEQRKIVDKDFSGPTKLTGVSGSGKTCVVIKRAIRLAQKYPNEKVLILTLHRSLAKLIAELVEYACRPQFRSGIVVRSFWEICQEELKAFEPENFEKYYNDVTWKNSEHISEIWDEYYHCRANNDDANVLLRTHRSLLAREVYPKDYLYQEFDYIRSAFSPSERQSYLEMQREARSIPFDTTFRNEILAGLASWEEKMRFVGITDYLGLATSLYRYIDKLVPKYRSVLVDEAQDFGNIELKLIRRLVAEGENDIFLAGDIAQQVCTKYQKLKETNIDSTGRSIVIRKNYRNSREILSAAYDVLHQNLAEETLKNKDFEIIDPEYADFSTPKPQILKAGNLNLELGHCYNYLKSMYTDRTRKACIAICGYTLLDIKKAGEMLALPVLDGSTSIDNDKIFLSDLEQTKGFEFDTLCILNCNRGVIPSTSVPKDETFRDLSKLYVAMTRAKRELIISFSSELSTFFEKSRDHFLFKDWSEHVQNGVIQNFRLPAPSSDQMEQQIVSLTGKDFLYTKKAVGIPLELQEKLIELIPGKRTFIDGKQRAWETIGAILQYAPLHNPELSRLFGPETYVRFKELFDEMMVR